MAAWCFVGVKIFGDLRFEAVFTLICGPMPVFQRNLRVARGPGGAQGEQVRWAPRHALVDDPGVRRDPARFELRLRPAALTGQPTQQHARGSGPRRLQ